MALIPGGTGGSRGQAVELYGFKQAADAVQAVPVNIKKNNLYSTVRNIGTVSSKAKDLFLSSIIRHGESGQGAGGRRQTGKFMFGKRAGAGAAFRGANFELKKGSDVYGFGFPDIAHADKVTEFVWRSLEFGLPGYGNPKGGMRGPVALYPENSRLFPKENMRMPRNFEFSSKNTATSYLYFGKRERKPDTRGIEGKHFIEGAWAESLEIMNGRYKRDVIDAAKVFGKS